LHGNDDGAEEAEEDDEDGMEVLGAELELAFA
jgi:hypothetical protein